MAGSLGGDFLDELYPRMIYFERSNQYHLIVDITGPSINSIYAMPCAIRS
jgi:hypothetical protein